MNSVLKKGSSFRGELSNVFAESDAVASARLQASTSMGAMKNRTLLGNIISLVFLIDIVVPYLKVFEIVNSTSRT